MRHREPAPARMFFFLSWTISAFIQKLSCPFVHRMKNRTCHYRDKPSRIAVSFSMFNVPASSDSALWPATVEPESCFDRKTTEGTTAVTPRGNPLFFFLQMSSSRMVVRMSFPLAGKEGGAPARSKRVRGCLTSKKKRSVRGPPA